MFGEQNIKKSKVNDDSKIIDIVLLPKNLKKQQLNEEILINFCTFSESSN